MTTHLTDTQKQTIRIALAKWIGWVNVGTDICEADIWEHVDVPFTLIPTERLPNYPASLDACHEIEVKLTDDQFGVYQRTLRRTVGGCGTYWNRPAISASAEQRSLALFRALNLGELGD